MEGYRTIIAAVVGGLVQLSGIAIDEEATVQAIITLLTTAAVIYFKIQANRREKELKGEEP